MSHEEVNDKRRDLVKALAKMVAEALPRSQLEEAMVEAMEQAIVAYRIDHYQVRSFLEKRIQERALELLNTTYKAEIDRLANQVIQAGLGKLDKR